VSRRRTRLRTALIVVGLTTAGCADRQPPLAPRVRANVLIYLVDTLRVDHLGCYGYPRPVSPAIDAFAAQGVRFENAVAHSSWTRPTVASVLTGLTPFEHGVRSLEDRLPEGVETLPEILRAAGWSTAAFSPNWHVSESTGFAQGFEAFDFFAQDPSSESLTRRVLSWLDTRPAEVSSTRPWFVYAHALDPHAPYDPPADLRRRFAGGVARPGAGSHDDIVATMKLRRRDRGDRVRDLRDLYDAEIADTDRQFGRLLEGLQARRQYDDTLIVLVSDHGEGFDEHALLGHGNSLYGELIDIPLIVKLPGPARPRTEAGLARQIDVLPTVLAALGLPSAPATSGRDLLSPRPSPETLSAVIDLSYERRRGIGLVTREWKYLAPLSRRFGRRHELYSRVDDRLDATDLADREPGQSGALARILALETRRPARRAPQATIDAPGEEALRALGYL
jgi:arylsulfatase A-like enzyme